MKPQGGFYDSRSGKPVSVDQVLEAINQSSDLDEAAILQLVSEGRMNEFFPFEWRPAATPTSKQSPFPRADELKPAKIDGSKVTIEQEWERIKQTLNTVR